MSKGLDPTLEFPFCHDVGKYERITKIGQGTFGYVFTRTIVTVDLYHYHRFQLFLYKLILKLLIICILKTGL